MSAVDGSVSLKIIDKRVSFFDFQGLLAPVFTCFQETDSSKLELQNVELYAQWLRVHQVGGIVVNDIYGEGPALTLNERKMNSQYWVYACIKHNLIIMLQIGGCAYPDVLELAEHAEELGVHGVICLPELCYKPHTIEQLVSYCKQVAAKCPTRPFLYYHLPDYTNVNLDMSAFCDSAEVEIPNFYGLIYASTDLEMGIQCLAARRIVILAHCALLAGALVHGFESAVLPVMNVQPQLAFDIFYAVINNDMEKAKHKQKQLNALVEAVTKGFHKTNVVSAWKKYFNEGGNSELYKPGFSAGPVRLQF